MTVSPTTPCSGLHKHIYTWTHATMTPDNDRVQIPEIMPTCLSACKLLLLLGLVYVLSSGLPLISRNHTVREQKLSAFQSMQKL